MGVVLPRALFAAPITLFWTVAAMARQVTEAAPVVVPPIPSGGLNSGDTAWMLTSTALVLLMTIPGLALFYGGMVRKMNVLATVMQSFAVTASSRSCGRWSAIASLSPEDRRSSEG